MNALIVYFSLYGNTRRVAEAIGDALEAGGPVRVLSFDLLPITDLSDVDLLIAGTPTHAANLPKELQIALDALPERLFHGLRVAAFDTANDINWFVNLFTAGRPLLRRLRLLGGNPLARPKSFYVIGREGPVCEGELERAQAWAEGLLATYRRTVPQLETR